MDGLELLIIALIVASLSYAVVLSTYLLYDALVLRNFKVKEYVRLTKRILTRRLLKEELPNVTAIIPMYNEESIIAKKLQNMAELDYPTEKKQVLLVDDCSTDRTCEIAENTISKLKLNGIIIRNPQRLGANASCNIGVANASNDFLLRTDADIMVDANALQKAVKIILAIDHVGGVTGMMDPVIDEATTATTIEKKYRNFFDKMSIAESALQSTFPGIGGFTLMKKTAYSPIPINQGSTDANVSLSMIKKGFRHIFIAETFCYELVSRSLREQTGQKARRARRLIQSTVANRDFLFNKKYREFGLVIFPLRFSMFVICPFLVFAAILSTFYLLFSYSFVPSAFLGLGAVLILCAGTTTKVSILNSFTSVLIQQFYLLLGLLLVQKKNSTWKSIKRIK